MNRPRYAVIFTSRRGDRDAEGYAAMAARMGELARTQPGFCGIESARGADGLGITVSYWDSLPDIVAWRDVAEHRAAQELGRTRWYDEYHVCVCRVESDRRFAAPSKGHADEPRSD